MTYKARTKAEREPIAILRWVSKQIARENYNQSTFCGSQCCIAGWIDIRVSGIKRHLEHHASEVCGSATMALRLLSSPWLFEPAFHGGPREIRRDAAADRKVGTSISPQLGRRAIKAFIEELEAKRVNPGSAL